jgi:DNA (cytosine-5)-methyltransferase 1
MTHGSLFSGIGGFDLAAQWMGWENVFHCEWNEFGKRVLKYYWPNAISYSDITKTDFTIHRGTINVLTGGFPCQPYSQAGLRLGDEDDRHLWPEMLRAIREIQPRWVVGENVRGLINWNGGLVFDEVQTDLEAEGYEVQPFLLPAAGVNAPHERYRIWFIAYSDRFGRKGGRSDGNGKKKTTKERTDIQFQVDRPREEWITPDTRSAGRKECHTPCFSDKKRYAPKFPLTNWTEWPTVSPVCHGNNGIPSGLDGITLPKWRSESIKAGGNAIVPQEALQIFKAIEQYQQCN